MENTVIVKVVADEDDFDDVLGYNIVAEDRFDDYLQQARSNYYGVSSDCDYFDVVLVDVDAVVVAAAVVVAVVVAVAVAVVVVVVAVVVVAVAVAVAAAAAAAAAVAVQLIVSKKDEYDDDEHDVGADGVEDLLLALQYYPHQYNVDVVQALVYK